MENDVTQLTSTCSDFPDTGSILGGVRPFAFVAVPSLIFTVTMLSPLFSPVCTTIFLRASMPMSPSGRGATLRLATLLSRRSQMEGTLSRLEEAVVDSQPASWGRSVVVLLPPLSSLEPVHSDMEGGGLRRSALKLRSDGPLRDRGGPRGRVVRVPTLFMANSCSPATPLPTLPMVVKVCLSLSTTTPYMGHCSEGCTIS